MPVNKVSMSYLVSMSKFTLKPKQESAVIALSAGGAVYDSFACRIQGVSNTSKLKGKYNHIAN